MAREREREKSDSLDMHYSLITTDGQKEEKKVFETCNMIELRLTSEDFGRYHTLHFAEA